MISQVHCVYTQYAVDHQNNTSKNHSSELFRHLSLNYGNYMEQFIPKIDCFQSPLFFKVMPTISIFTIFQTFSGNIPCHQLLTNCFNQMLYASLSFISIILLRNKYHNCRRIHDFIRLLNHCTNGTFSFGDILSSTKKSSHI